MTNNTYSENVYGETVYGLNLDIESIPTSLSFNPSIAQIILDRSIPEFIKINNPLLYNFLLAFYEFQEQQFGPLDIIKNLHQYRDIDTTLDQFVENFRKEYLVNIPQNVLCDPRLLVKQIKKFYQSKGTEASWRFLFRILFNEDIQFYYPKNDMLKLSDGQWIQTTTIKIKQNSMTLGTDVSFFFTSAITGATSHAYAEVQSITAYTERGVNIMELDLINTKGIFLPGETIVLVPGNSSAPSPILVEEVYNAADILAGGGGYVVGDPLSIIDASNNVVGSAQVSIVGRGPVTGLSIDVAGINYNGLEKQITNFYYLPYDFNTYSNENVWDSPYTTSDLDLWPLGWSFSIPTEILNGIPDEIIINDTPDPIGSGAGGIVSLVDQTGAILAVELEEDGVNYTNPKAIVQSSTGSGAVIAAGGGGGNVQGIQLNSFPIITPDSNGFDYLGIDFADASGSGASAELTGSAGTIRYPGSYLNTGGQLSSDKKIQDSYFYQAYSYVIQSSITESMWQNIVADIIHPAGFQGFGRLKFTAEFLPLDVPIIAETEQIVITPGELLTSDTVDYLETSDDSRISLSLTETSVITEIVVPSGRYSMTGYGPLSFSLGWTPMIVTSGSYAITGNSVVFGKEIIITTGMYS